MTAATTGTSARPTTADFAERVCVEYNPTTGIAFIDLDDDVAGYYLDVVAGEGGVPLGLAFTKIRTREVHCVGIDAGAVCGCKGYLYRGHCRHSVAATRLIEEGLI